MPRMIFVSLPVHDLARSIAFYEALGFTRNPQFSDASSACMVWTEGMHVMLLQRDKWAQFTRRPIPSPDSSEMALNLNYDSRAEVDAICAAATAAGGRPDANPVQDLGFMYSRDMLDPDGHVVGGFWMDPAAVPAQS